LILFLYKYELRYLFNQLNAYWDLVEMKISLKVIVILGTILLIVGIIGAIIAYNVIIKNPSDIAESKLFFNYEENIYYGSISQQEVRLDEGEYDIWYEPDQEFFGMISGSPQGLTIEDSDGKVVYSKTSFLGHKEGSISKGGKKYNRYCTFSIEKADDYSINVSNPCIIYITPKIDVGLGEALGILSILIMIIGIIVLLIGVVLFAMRKRRKTKPSTTKQPVQQQYSYYYQYPAYSGYPPQSPWWQPQYPHHQPQEHKLPEKKSYPEERNY